MKQRLHWCPDEIVVSSRTTGIDPASNKKSITKLYKYATNLDEDMAMENPEEVQMIRVRIPQGKEILGIVQQRLGGSRMRVLCLDGKERICRIPGRLRRELWVRENDVVLIEPWELGGDDKADVVYKYRGKAEVEFLRKKGYLKGLDNEL